jgi:hypothetical protein
MLCTHRLFVAGSNIGAQRQHRTQDMCLSMVSVRQETGRWVEKWGTIAPLFLELPHQ